jgi:hypothetical protein
MDTVRGAILVLASHTFTVALLAAGVGILLGVPLRQMLVPFALFALCGLLLTPLLGWSYRANDRPKTGGVRMGITWFVYLQATMAALELTGLWLGIVPVADAVFVAVWMAICVVPISVGLSVWWRRRLERLPVEKRGRLT